MTFQELGLIPPILKALAEQGYETPSPIQEKAIPPALEGRDVLGCAQTGTGKTCAFAAPILQRLNANPVQGRPIRALILTPTRELALQIQENIEEYARHLSIRSAVIFGGVGQAPQVAKLKQGVDILVATPGRLGDLYNQKLLDLSRMEIFVLDEADRMLDMGFIHDVRKVLKWLPQQKQTLFFSATMPTEITDLVNSLLHNPVKVAVDPVSSPVEVIAQKLYFVDRGNKTKLLAAIIQENKIRNALVFTRTKHGANKVVTELIKMGVTASAIHGNKSQTARQQALADFKAGRVTALVATDIAARGLDIDELSHVFNYNLPDVPETYVHRIGRTGRAGRDGTAISFCDITEKSCLKDVEKLIRRQVPVEHSHPWPMEIMEAPPKDTKGRAVNPDDAEARAAAKERRRDREAANKVAADNRRAKENQKILGIIPNPLAAVTGKGPAKRKPAPQDSAPRHGGAAVGDKKKARGYRASTTLEEALTATAPKGRSEKATDNRRRPNPMDSDVILDATARMLAPRSGGRPTAQEPSRPQSGTRNSPPKKQQPAPQERARQGSAPQKPAAAPDTRRRPGGRGKGGRPPEVQLRGSNQKDSTEQPSLMKPYYINRDD